MSLSGNLQDFELSEVVQFLGRGKHTGLLTITTEQGSGHGQAILTTAKVYFDRGRVAFATAGFRSRLGNRLMDLGIVDRENLRCLLDKQRLSPSRKRFGSLLIEEEILSQESLQQHIHAQVFQIIGAALDWRAGTFKFEKQPVEVVEELGANNSLPVDTLLLEIHRRHDEAILDAARLCLPEAEIVPATV